MPLQVDRTGRIVATPEKLHELLRAAASLCPECSDNYFGRVFWHKRDSEGCNWSVSTMTGNDPKGCFDRVLPTAIALRMAYSLPEQDEGS